MEANARRDVRLRVNDAPLEGCLAVPDGARGFVVLVNGGWGVRYASRESKLAVALRRRGFGTFGVDLLTPQEDGDRASRFATTARADRLAGVTDWLDCQESTAGLPCGLLGVGPGAGTALRAVQRCETGVGAVVCLDGRFGAGVEDVSVPTRLVVQRREDRLLESNRRVCDRLGGDDQEVVVLYPDGVVRDGTDDVETGRVDRLVADWFEAHLGGRS